MKPQTGTQNWLKPPNRQTIIDPHCKFSFYNCLVTKHADVAQSGQMVSNIFTLWNQKLQGTAYYKRCHQPKKCPLLRSCFISSCHVGVSKPCSISFMFTHCPFTCKDLVREHCRVVLRQKWFSKQRTSWIVGLTGSFKGPLIDLFEDWQGKFILI